MYCEPSFRNAAFARALLVSEATVAGEVEHPVPDFPVRALIDDDAVLDIPPWERLEGTISAVAASDGIGEPEEPVGPEELGLAAVDVVLRVL